FCSVAEPRSLPAPRRWSKEGRDNRGDERVFDYKSGGWRGAGKRRSGSVDGGGAWRAFGYACDCANVGGAECAALSRDGTRGVRASDAATRGARVCRGRSTARKYGGYVRDGR